MHYLETGIDLYDEVLLGIFHAYYRFHGNVSLYKSNSLKNKLLELTSSFLKPKYARTGIFIYTPESNYYDEPYMDGVIASSISEGHPLLKKRVNLIYQSLNDPINIMARTTPATNDFIIPSVQSVNSMFESVEPGSIVLTKGYLDQFSISNNQSQTIAIRINFPLQNNTEYRMLVEIQMSLILINTSLNIQYLTESAAIAMIYVKDLENKEYEILGSSKSFEEYENILNFSKYLEQGFYNVTTENQEEFMVGTKKLMNENSIISKYGVEDHQYDNPILITFLNKSEINQADSSYYPSLWGQINQLTEFMIVWSFITISLMSAIGYAIVQYLFSSCQYAKKTSTQYLKDNKSFECSYFEMKQKASQQTYSGAITQNMLPIIQKIQGKKKAYSNLNSIKSYKRQKKKLNKNYQLENQSKSKLKKQLNAQMPYDMYPLNLLHQNFQTKIGNQRYRKV